MRSAVHTLLFTCFILGAAGQVAAQTAPAGNIEAGKAAWAIAPRCGQCHGAQAEGGFGPDLAGRALTFDQFRRAVRQPWGVMLAYTEAQLSEKTLADMYAFVNSLPKPAQVGLLAYETTAGAPMGQVYLVDGIGCGQCHQPEIRQPRRVLGGEAADVTYDLFAKLIYEHTAEFPAGRMGNYSKKRLPEMVVREMYRFIKDDLGLLVPITATILPGTAAGANTTYTLTVTNTGVKGKGLTAEDVTISLMLPQSAKIVGQTGAGYQGVKPNTQGDRDTKGDAAVWTLANIVPGQEIKYTVTLPGAPAPPATLFRDSTVMWTKPAMRTGVPNLQLRDQRMARKDDYQAVTFPNPPAPPPVTSSPGAAASR